MNEGPPGRKPRLSVVVVVHDCPRQTLRTLYSLSADYQRDITAADYEVIVVDNGSSPTFDASVFDGLAGVFRLLRPDPARATPAKAINAGLTAARGDVIGVMSDGARLVSPGLLHFARAGAGLYRRSIVATFGWRLGPDPQQRAVEAHDAEVREDALLDRVDWRADGYRLFEIAAPGETTVDDWFSAICGSNALFLARETWRLLDEVDERLDAPGGGFANHGLMIQALELPDSRLVVLPGEGTFHQYGGVATSADPRAMSGAINAWRARYKTIHGRDWAPPGAPEHTCLGVLPHAPLARFARAVLGPLDAPILGEVFDRDVGLLSSPPLPAMPAVAALVDLARDELHARRFAASAAVARIARGAAPGDPSVRHISAMAAAWLRGAADAEELGPTRRANYQMARGKALAILGRTSEASGAFHAALQCNDDLSDARLHLAMLRMPGEDYLWWLEQLHAHIAPAIYLEIGVDSGRSLALANPPTKVIGVDPDPHVRCPLRTEATILRETSDAFFAQNRLDTFLDGAPLKLTFIDGLHVFRQTLRDFVNVERFCAPDSYILLHDTIPLDEITQRADRQRKFYTGDTWKAVLCLKHYRPELTIFTIPTFPSGLTVITNLNPESVIIRDNFDEAVSIFDGIPYAELEHEVDDYLNMVPNQWESVAMRLSPASKAEQFPG